MDDQARQECIRWIADTRRSIDQIEREIKSNVLHSSYGEVMPTGAPRT